MYVVSLSSFLRRPRFLLQPWLTSSTLRYTRFLAVINSSSIQGQKDYNKALSSACRSHIRTNSSEFNVLTESHATGEVDDEVDSDSDSGSQAGDDDESKSFPDGTVDFLMEDPVRTALFVLLVVSLLFNVLNWIRGGSGGGVEKVVQQGSAGVWKGGEEVQNAMERLERIEREWEGVRVCLSAKVGGVLEG